MEAESCLLAPITEQMAIPGPVICELNTDSVLRWVSLVAFRARAVFSFPDFVG